MASRVEDLQNEHPFPGMVMVIYGTTCCSILTSAKVEAGERENIGVWWGSRDYA